MNDLSEMTRFGVGKETIVAVSSTAITVVEIGFDFQ